eukprot:jgi/Botrbrau1/18988/Bobra.0100s0024.2
MELFNKFTPMAGRILVKDSLQSDGNFLISWMLRLAIQAEAKIIFVSSHESASHYHYVMRRLAHLDSGRLVVIPVIGSMELDMEGGPGGLLEGVQKGIDDAMGDASHHGFTLIIDSLHELYDLVGNEQLWYRFLMWCGGLAYKLKGQFNFVTLVHEDIPEDAKWIRFLEHGSDVVIHLTALASGQSVDISGQMVVTRRAAPRVLEGALDAAKKGVRHDTQEARRSEQAAIRNFFYKTSDTGVRLSVQAPSPF